MEQTNLVVTPDGQTWDEVTRDTSYLGPSVQASLSRDGGNVSNSMYILDFTRGESGKKNMVQKGVALAYDRIIILEDGLYEISFRCYSNVTAAVVYFLKNSTTENVASGQVIRFHGGDDSGGGRRTWNCKRGDYIAVRVSTSIGSDIVGTETGYTDFDIIKLN